MSKQNQIIYIENIQNLIFTIRGKQVMLDSDLAEMYDVELKRLNEQVKRNINRFPEKFRFQLSKEEYEILRSQFATSSEHDGKTYPATIRLPARHAKTCHRPCFKTGGAYC